MRIRISGRINKKGAIGQFLTSIPVLFVLIVLMIFFVFASSAIGGARNRHIALQEIEYNGFSFDNAQRDSQILLRLFLNDYVFFQDDKKVKVSDAVWSFNELNYGEKLDRAFILEGKWDSEYSCRGENKFSLEAKVLSDGREEFELFLGANPLSYSSEYSGRFYQIEDEELGIRVSILGGVKCGAI